MEMIGAVGGAALLRIQVHGVSLFVFGQEPMPQWLFHKFIYKLQMGVVVRFDRKSKQRNGC